MSAEARLAELRLELPPVPKPAGVYKPVVVVGQHGLRLGPRPAQERQDDAHRPRRRRCRSAGGVAGRAANRAWRFWPRCANTSAASTTSCASSKCWAWSIARPTSPQHPHVINGCSELFRDVWGDDHGVAARSAVGMGSLPGNITTEIEAIFELDPSVVGKKWK